MIKLKFFGKKKKKKIKDVDLFSFLNVSNIKYFIIYHVESHTLS